MFAKLPRSSSTAKKTPTNIIPSQQTSKTNVNSTCGLEDNDLLRLHNMSLCKNEDDTLYSLVELSIVVESPPLQSHGNPDESSGAFFSGQFAIEVRSVPIEFDSLEVRLIRITTTTKPTAQPHRKDCQSHSAELQKWTFTKLPVNIPVGKHKFPFNYVFPGDCPASTSSQYAMIDYQFLATANTKTGRFMTHKHNVQLERVFSQELENKRTVVFPSLNIHATINYNSVCFIGHKIPINLRLTGIERSSDISKTYCRVKKLIWQVEEHQEATVMGCTNHHTEIHQTQKHVRTLSTGQFLYDKYHSKFITPTKKIEANFAVLVTPEANCITDLQAPEIKLHIWHTVIVDMLVLVEEVPKQTSSQSRTSSEVKAKFLRLEFPITLSKYGGTAVAWDKEIPPIYRDIPVGPPDYHDASHLWSQSPPEYC